MFKNFILLAQQDVRNKDRAVLVPQAMEEMTMATMDCYKPHHFLLQLQNVFPIIWLYIRWIDI